MSSVICLPACSPGPLLPSATVQGGGPAPASHAEIVLIPPRRTPAPAPAVAPRGCENAGKARLVPRPRGGAGQQPCPHRQVSREAAMRALALPQDGTAGIRLVLYFTKGLGDVVAAEVSGIVPSAAIQLAGD